MLIEHISPQRDREAWLKARRAGLGSSDVPAIVLKPDARPGYLSPWGVWRSKVLGIEPDLDGNLFVEFGNRFERSVGEHIAEKCGATLQDGGWYVHDDHPWMMASPDFWIKETGRFTGSDLDSPYIEAGEPEGVECKVIQNPVNASDWLINSAPPHVTVQAHWCMMVTGAKRWHVGALLWYSQEFRHYTIEHDQAFADKLFDRADKWWRRHVIQGEEPDVDDTAECAETLLFQARTPDELIREGNEAEAAAVEHYLKTKEAAKIAKAEHETAKNFLKQLVSGNRGIQTEHGRILWSFCSGRETLDQKALKEAHPDIFSEFTKKGDDYRRMTFSKNKGK